MTATTETRMVTISGLVPPTNLSSEQAQEHRRRYAVLLRDDDTAPICLGDFILQKAHTAENAPVAIKTCALAGILSLESERKRLEAEFEELTRLSMYRLFPTAYGFGELDGSPVIVQDWIEGVPLQNVPFALLHTQKGAGAWPLDTAVIGAELYRHLNLLAKYDAGERPPTPSPNGVIVDTSKLSLREQMDTMSLDLRFVNATTPSHGGDSTDFLAMLLGEPAALREAQRISASQPTRSEHDALVWTLAYGKTRGLDADAMHRSLVRWLRIHKYQRMLPDGSTPYPLPLDRRLFIASQPGEKRVYSGVANSVLGKNLDRREANRVVGRETPLGDLFSDLLGSMGLLFEIVLFFIVLLAFGAAFFAVGWSLPLIV